MGWQMDNKEDKRFARMEEGLQWITLEIEGLQKENEALKWKDAESEWGGGRDQNWNCNEKSQSEERPIQNDQEEKKRMHNSLQGLMDKYEEMSKQVRASALVDNLLNRTDC